MGNVTKLVIGAGLIVGAIFLLTKKETPQNNTECTTGQSRIVADNSCPSGQRNQSCVDNVYVDGICVPENNQCVGCNGQADGAVRTRNVADPGCCSGSSQVTEECNCNVWSEVSRTCVNVCSNGEEESIVDNNCDITKTKLRSCVNGCWGSYTCQDPCSIIPFGVLEFVGVEPEGPGQPTQAVSSSSDCVSGTVCKASVLFKNNSAVNIRASAVCKTSNGVIFSSDSRLFSPGQTGSLGFYMPLMGDVVVEVWEINETGPRGGCINQTDLDNMKLNLLGLYHAYSNGNDDFCFDRVENICP